MTGPSPSPPTTTSTATATDGPPKKRDVVLGSVTSLNCNDVLLGRGSGPNDHCGNVAFRTLVSTRRREYLVTSTRTQKAQIAKDIVGVVWSRSPPGRFLVKVEQQQRPAGDETTTDGNNVIAPSWNVVSQDKALEKVKQALRQMRHRRSESNEQDYSSVVAVMGKQNNNSNNNNNTEDHTVLSTTTTITSVSSSSNHRRARSAPASSFDFLDVQAQKQQRGENGGHRRTNSRSSPLSHYNSNLFETVHDTNTRHGEELLFGEPLCDTFHDPLPTMAERYGSTMPYQSPQSQQLSYHRSTHPAASNRGVYSNAGLMGAPDGPSSYNNIPPPVPHLPPAASTMSSRNNNNSSNNNSNDIYATSGLKFRMYDSDANKRQHPLPSVPSNNSVTMDNTIASLFHPIKSSVTSTMSNHSPTTTSVFGLPNNKEPQDEEDDFATNDTFTVSTANFNGGNSRGERFRTTEDCSTLGTMGDFYNDDDNDDMVVVEPQPFRGSRHRTLSSSSNQQDHDAWTTMLDVLESDSSLPQYSEGDMSSMFSAVGGSTSVVGNKQDGSVLSSNNNPNDNNNNNNNRNTFEHMDMSVTTPPELYKYSTYNNMNASGITKPGRVVYNTSASGRMSLHQEPSSRRKDNFVTYHHN